jgi:hypothetical protein
VNATNALLTLQFRGLKLIIASNVGRCVAIIGDLLALPPASISCDTDALRIEVHVRCRWNAPEWLDGASSLWSNGRGYHLYRIHGDPVVLVDGVAWARFHRAARCLRIEGTAQVADDEFLLTQALLSTLLPSALRLWSWLPLHACAVDWDGRAILLPAASGSGKSTLALALVRAGFRLVSEDMPLLKRDADGTFRVYRFPEHNRVLPATLDFFPELQGVSSWATPSGPKLLFDLSKVYGDCFVEESRPAVIVTPRIAHAPVSAVRPAPAAAALAELMTGMAFGSTGETMADALPTLAAFVASCRTYALDTGTDFDRLPHLLRDLLAGS